MVSELKTTLVNKLSQMQYNFVNKFDSSEYNCMELDFSSSDSLTLQQTNNNLNNNTQIDTKTQTLHRWPIVVYLITAAICLLLSSLYHLVYCHS
jgi:type II secretory pathway component PulF